ncbi:MAG: YggS family pyridoxal phosphate-dependent enzyme [Planctomycetota bacterium]|nr:YggS family pyridoxal phosphate-dependent enzyme [Planctomycetota bacterium]
MSTIHEILGQRLEAIRTRVQAACGRVGRSPESVTLIGVTKTVGHEVAQALVDLGVADLGENRPQELWRKSDLVSGARWHVIGHLQRNKVERTVGLSSLIHSVDSERLLEAIETEAKRIGKQTAVLLEVNCSGEEAKHGFTPEAILAFTSNLKPLHFVRIEGLMTMAALADDPEAARPAFRRLAGLRKELRQVLGDQHPLNQLSMGMSGDFEVAIEEGATHIRLGTVLVGGLDPT